MNEVSGFPLGRPANGRTAIGANASLVVMDRHQPDAGLSAGGAVTVSNLLSNSAAVTIAVAPVTTTLRCGHSGLSDRSELTTTTGGVLVIINLRQMLTLARAVAPLLASMGVSAAVWVAWSRLSKSLPSRPASLAATIGIGFVVLPVLGASLAAALEVSSLVLLFCTFLPSAVFVVCILQHLARQIPREEEAKGPHGQD